MKNKKAISVNKSRIVISIFFVLQLMFACKTNKSITTTYNENQQDSAQASQKNYQTRFNIKETTTAPAQTISDPNTPSSETKNTGSRPR